MNLKTLRLKKNLTQSELAVRLGVKESTICNYEKGTRHPNILVVRKLCEILECSPNELLAK